MTNIDCQQFLRFMAELEGIEDIRNPPDNLRHRNFRLGWRDAVERGKQYSEATLSRLTWQNLGYRMGARFGSLADDDINAAFECLGNDYRTCRGGDT